MAVNVVPVSARSAPIDTRTLANGSYTLPAYAYIPHAALSQIGTGHVGTPVGNEPALFRAVPGQSYNANFPTAQLTGVFGTRLFNVKTSPL